MKHRLFAVDTFPVGLTVLGMVLLVFPSLRVAGVIAVLLAVAYWLMMVALRLMRR
jgi:hypothetical protein